MKTLKFILCIMLIAFLQSNSFSQLKVFSNGYVGINGAVPDGYPLGVRSYYGQTIMIDPSVMSILI
jgi:hypothetical protein